MPPSARLLACLILLPALLLARPGWASPSQLPLDSVRRVVHIQPATARAWEARARRPDLARLARRRVLGYLAGYYIHENQPSLAIPQMLELLRLAPHDTIGCASSNMWLCYCYYLLRQPTKGLPYGQLAVRLLLAHQPVARQHLLQAYSILGDCASLLPGLALAQRYYLRVLPLAQAERQPTGIAVAWANLATVSLKRQQLAPAARQLDSARQALGPRPLPGYENILDQLAGDLALQQHHYAAAAAVLEHARAYAHHIRALHAEMQQLRLLATAVLALGRPVAAVRYQQRLLELQDSLFEQTSYQHAQELQALYETSRQQQQLAQQQQRIAALQLRAAAISRRTTLLVGGLLAVGLGLGFGLLRQRTRRRLALVALAQRVRSRIAADLHDEVGTLLTRVSLQAELLAQPPTQPTADAQPHAAAFARLLANSRAAARTMRDIVWSIDAGADTVGALLDRMRDHLDQTAAPAGLRTQLRVAHLADADPLAGELRQHLYLIFKEAVTNAARHAQGATTLHVSLARAGGVLRLTVRDNGQATARSPRSSMGLRNMRQRAQALGGQLRVGPCPGGGFQVLLLVPA